MKTLTLLLPLALLAAAPVQAMTGCDLSKGAYDALDFSAKILDAHSRGEDRQSVLARALAEPGRPAWYADMARETVAEVYGGLRPIKAPVYSVYRGMICYYALLRPNENVVVNYAAIHPALQACESKRGQQAQAQCSAQAVDSYFRRRAK
ncbi:hypothetical protein [Stenotrophomonas cyclobalanopsidis]|uniref:hypothetical protein n=1 Tax=Stenotrophomonas cyclobalanopsidis TaxID=2771362 RepID=UPI003460CE12